MVDQRCRESKGKVKIEGYMSVSDEEAHQRVTVTLLNRVYLAALPSYHPKISFKISTSILSTYSVPEYNSQIVLLSCN